MKKATEMSKIYIKIKAFKKPQYFCTANFLWFFMPSNEMLFLPFYVFKCTKNYLRCAVASIRFGTFYTFFW